MLSVLSLAALTSWVGAAATSISWTAAMPATTLLALDLVALVASGRRRAAARRVVARDIARRTAVAGRKVAAAQAAARVAAAADAVAAAARLSVAVSAAAGESIAGRPLRIERRVGDRRRSARHTPDRRVAAVGVGSPMGAAGSTVVRHPVLAVLPGMAQDAGAAGAAEVAQGAGVVEVKDDRENTWVPVAVPPPTYTLKPVAHRAEPRPLELPRTGTADWADDLDLDAVLARRRAVNG